VFTADGAQSLPATQTVTVKNVNDPTALAFTVAAGAGAAPLQVYAVNGPSDAANPSVLTITGFAVSDPDLGVDPVKAVVTSSRGLVTLNPAHTAALDFNSQKYCLAGPSSARWTCRGDGTNDATMVFLGTPADVARALNGLTYLSVHPHTTDLLNVTLYDGAGGACLDNAQLGPGSVRVGCFVATVSVPVTVLGYAGVAAGRAPTATATASLTALPVQVNVLGGLLCGVLALLTCKCCWRAGSCCRRQHSEEAQKDAKGGPGPGSPGGAVPDECKSDGTDVESASPSPVLRSKSGIDRFSPAKLPREVYVPDSLLNGSEKKGSEKLRLGSPLAGSGNGKDDKAGQGQGQGLLPGLWIDTFRRGSSGAPSPAPAAAAAAAVDLDEIVVRGRESQRSRRSSGSAHSAHSVHSTHSVRSARVALVTEPLGHPPPDASAGPPGNVLRRTSSSRDKQGSDSDSSNSGSDASGVSGGPPRPKPMASVRTSASFPSRRGSYVHTPRPGDEAPSAPFRGRPRGAAPGPGPASPQPSTELSVPGLPRLLARLAEHGTASVAPPAPAEEEPALLTRSGSRSGSRSRSRRRRGAIFETALPLPAPPAPVPTPAYRAAQSRRDVPAALLPGDQIPSPQARRQSAPHASAAVPAARGGTVAGAGAGQGGRVARSQGPNAAPVPRLFSQTESSRLRSEGRSSRGTLEK